MSFVSCVDGPVLTMECRGVVKMSDYISVIFAKLTVPRPTKNFSETLYSHSFSCAHCARSVIESIQERLALMDIHSYHILPPGEALGTATYVARLFRLLVFTFENGPVVPVIISVEQMEQQQRLVHELYTLPIFNNIQIFKKNPKIPR